MKKIVAFGLCALVAAGAMTAVSGSASAKPMWMYQQHPPMMFYQHHHRRHPSATFYFSTPLLFGFSFGPQLYSYQTYQPLYPYQAYSMNPHVDWCLTHYRTYNPATNLFFVKKGVPAVCVSPFSC